MVKGGGVWNNILILITKIHIKGEVEESVMCRNLGHGFDIRSLWDKWGGTTTFKDKYDRLYALALKKAGLLEIFAMILIGIFN